MKLLEGRRFQQQLLSVIVFACCVEVVVWYIRIVDGGGEYGGNSCSIAESSYN